MENKNKNQKPFQNIFLENSQKYLIQSKLKNIVLQLFQIDLGDISNVHLERPQDTSLGDWSTNISMQLAGRLKKNPRELASVLVEEIKSVLNNIADIDVAGPGFINIKIADQYFISHLSTILIQKDDYGKSENLKGKRIMMEYAHPNPFKSFHIGHLRNIILGESLIRLIEAHGAEVIRTNYQGDVGMHIAKCIWAFQKVDPTTYPDSADEKVAMLGKCYVDGAKAFEEDENVKEEIKGINKKIYNKEDETINSLWSLGKEWSLEKFHEIYKRVDSTFVREYMESEVADEGVKYVKKAIEKGILKKDDGAVIFDGKKYGIGTRVFLNSRGLPTYEGKELGLAYAEFSDYGHIDLCIHNVGSEQINFFQVTFKVEELLDPELFNGRQYHNAYELVDLKGGKMSSRKGNVILGNDILNEARNIVLKITKEKGKTDDLDVAAEVIAVGAVKYSMLKMSAFKKILFDIDESVNFQGDSGPYLLYTYARAKSILREGEFDEKSAVEKLIFNKTEELDLIRYLERFPENVLMSTKELSPHFVAVYLNDLAKLFNAFYKSNTVLKAETDEIRNSRLALTAATAQVLKNGLNLLGIKVLEKM